MAKRILWLLNHGALRNFEVPLLISMGYEVYCPKIYQIGFGDTSASCTDEFDSSLTVDKNIIEKLNKVDFYDVIPLDVQTILNDNFDIAFCMFVTDQAKNFAKFFKGQIVVRWFGALYETSYTELHNHDTLEVFKQCGNRFWFAYAYENLLDIECDFLKNRALYLPIGMKKAVPEHKWKGGDKRFLFVCPKIGTDIYYNNVYNEFKDNFKGFDYIIGGNQIQPVVDDDKVVGYLEQEEYDYNMTNLLCMFYHSQEKYHLHYHPLEAVRAGMPLIFMAGGMLDTLGGRMLPGRCKNIDEAKHKIRSLLKGDTALLNKIINTQDVLLEKFSEKYCRPFWNKGLNKIEESLAYNQNKVSKAKKIGLILPLAYTGGVLDVAKRFALALKKAIDYYNKNIQIVFGYPDDFVLENHEAIKELKRNNITCRTFIPVKISEAEIEKVQTLKGYKATRERNKKYGTSCILDDDVCYFDDCDYLIYIADRSGNMKYPVFSEKPYAMIIHDIIQRYVPESVPTGNEFKNMIVESYRRADHLFALSIPAMNDCIQYSNINKEKLSVLPLMYDYVTVRQDTSYETGKLYKLQQKKYFVWSSNISPHKNHITALIALANYYDHGGTMDCVITGFGTKNLNPKYARESSFPGNEHVNKVHYIFNKYPSLSKHLKFMGNMKKDEYLDVLHNAAFFFHPGYADNGNMGFFDAACLGVPTLSNKYPAMEYCAKFTNIPTSFMNGFEEKDIEEALFRMEKEYDKWADKLPSSDELKKVSIGETWRIIYRELAKYIGI